MRREAFESSNVASIGFELEPDSPHRWAGRPGASEDVGTLEVEFHGGRVYRYRLVPAFIWEDLRGIGERGGSVGAYFAASVKARFTGRRCRPFGFWSSDGAPRCPDCGGPSAPVEQVDDDPELARCDGTLLSFTRLRDLPGVLHQCLGQCAEEIPDTCALEGCPCCASGDDCPLWSSRLAEVWAATIAAEGS